VPTDARTFPLPRRGRTGPASSLDNIAAALGSALPAPPRSRVFPFQFSETANTRRTLSTPKLIGPAILRKAFFQTSTKVAPPNESLEFGWALSPVTEAGVALTVIRPYTVLTELLDPFGVSNIAIGKGFPNFTLPGGTVGYEVTLDLIITEPQLAFTVSLINNGINAQQWIGWMSVIEAVSPSALTDFIGS
jgi:hypothetical protein